MGGRKGRTEAKIFNPPRNEKKAESFININTAVYDIDIQKMR